MNWLIFFLQQNSLLAFAIKDGRDIQSLPILGEANWFPVPKITTFKAALGDIHEHQRLAYSTQDEQPICLIYDQASAELLDGYAQWRGAISGQWEWLRWERVRAQLKADVSQHPAPHLIKESFLPIVLQTLQATTPHKTATPQVPTEQLSDVAELRARCQSLEAQLHQHKQMQPFGENLHGEQLLAFLPALYVQAFSILNGADLALLLGRVEPFDIPSPYPEHNEEFLDKKQREFRLLPREQQRQIVAFAHSISKRLRPRPKMQALIAELTDS